MFKALRFAVFMCGVIFCSISAAFDLDGVYSGMTREQVRSFFAERGLEARDLGTTGLLIGDFKANRIDGSVSFCGDGLVWYSKSIDFDAAYIQTFQDLVKKFGQPQRVTVEKNPWTGPGAGYVYGIGMRWVSKKDEITLFFYPEGRDGHGAIRYSRAASVIYTTANNCAGKPAEKN